MIIYDFRIGSRLDMRSIKILNLTCSEMRLNYETIDQGLMMESLKILNQTKQKFPTTSIKQLTINLTNNSAVHFLAFLSRSYQIEQLCISQSNEQPLLFFLSLPNISFNNMSITLPEHIEKAKSPKNLCHNNELSINNCFSNENLKHLSLKF